MASQNRRMKWRRYIQLLTTRRRSHVWLRKALKPEGQIVDYCTTGWIPSHKTETTPPTGVQINLHVFLVV